MESYHLAFQRRRGQDEIQLFAGRYLDLFQRRDGAWAIFRRTVVYDWSLMTRPTSQSRLPLDQFAHGGVYPGDPVYQRSSSPATGAAAGTVLTGVPAGGLAWIWVSAASARR